jgi:galactonate dehydratase
MKITALKTFLVPPRWLFLKIETDEGLCGWGEPVLEGRAQTVAAALAELSDLLVGKDPSPIEDHWSVLYRGGFYRGGAVLMSAIAGIDQALWDLKGKVLGQPVHRVLGGPVREKIRAYSWISGDGPEALAASARKAAENGFTAVKMLATGEMGHIDTFAKIDGAVRNVATVRDAVGGEFGIGVDFHGRVHRPMVKALVKELEPLRLMFVEEPVLSEHLDVLRDVRAQFSIPIALGERLYSRWDFMKVFESGLVDVIQPDVSHAGGITETRKIATMAECYDVALAPHCPLGPIALAASLQVDAVCANAAIQEQSIGMHYNAGAELLDYVKDASVFAFDEGHLRIPSGPGLGIEINEESVAEQAKTGHRWRSPSWRHEDGSVAEW